MPEPISTVAAISIAGTALLSSIGQDYTASESGSYVQSQAISYKKYAQSPASQSRSRPEVIAQLREMLADCTEEGWDGDSAPVLTSPTVIRMKEILAALPQDIKDPELSIEPDDASLSLEWHGGYRKVASISINTSNRIAFASLQGTSISHGAYHINHGELPNAILATIREIQCS